MPGQRATDALCSGHFELAEMGKLKIRVPDHIAWNHVILLAALLCASGRIGRTEEGSGGGAAVSLGSVAGTAKGEVSVPLMLAARPSGTKIGSIEMTVAFESLYVAFQRAEKGFLLDGVGGAIETQEFKDPDNPKKSLVRVRGGDQR